MPSDNHPTPVAEATCQPTRKSVPARLDLSTFPHPPAPGSSKLQMTLENVEHLLTETGISARFDVISKRLVVQKNGKPCNFNDIASTANLNGLTSAWLFPFIEEIAARNPLNPVKDWIESKPWDGVDRLPEILATVRAAEGYPEGLKTALLYRWLLSATAAATLEGRRFSSRGVLTLQGGQGIGKTSWIANLLPAGKLRDAVIKRDHHLDGGNKDSIIGAVSHWIVEIGELDSSFKKDIARLKGFLTNDCDKLRPPYGRHEVEFDRRTVFAATVNDETFLIDHTGNSRFWTIAVESLDFQHSVDMQQLYAQLSRNLAEGQQWWLTPVEEAKLASYNQRHRSVSAIAERIKDFIDLEHIGLPTGQYMTAIQVLTGIGIANPSNSQCRECGTALRELLGAPKRVNGRDKWRVPIAAHAANTWVKPEPEDIY